MVKFRIGFTIEAETLFAYAHRFIPSLQDLHVEEIMDAPIVKQPKIEKPKIENKKRDKPIPHFKHPSGKSLIDFVFKYMENNEDGIAFWKELSAHALELGFHKSSINNAITRLIERDLIKKVGPGKYQLTKTTIKTS